MELEFKEKFISNLSWYNMPGRRLYHGMNHDLYQKTYLHWKNTWIDILDAGQNLLSDNFVRQDLLCPLVYNNDVIGLIGCNFFNLRQMAMHDHSYIRKFPEELFAHSRFDEIVMSIEYLSVSTDFRKSHLGISLGDVLLGLSMKVFKHSPAKFVLGTARKKIHVDQMCYQFGFNPAGEIHTLGLECALIINDKTTLREHPHSNTRELIDKLWMNRNEVNPTTSQYDFAMEAI